MSTNTPESPITVTVDHDPRGVSVGVWQGSHCVYSGAHPLPATPGVSTMEKQRPSRDWELTCDECDGSGHVYVKHQVAERQSDVQEFKEECECCEGRGFVFAFQDIPGIEEYVKACRTASSAPGVSTVEDAQAEQPYCYALETRGRHGDQQDVLLDVEYNGTDSFSGGRTGGIPLYRRPAPAAGDALDLTLAQKYEDACILANANARDAERYRQLRKALTSYDTGWLDRIAAALEAMGLDPDEDKLPTPEQVDGAFDAAQRKGDA